MRSILSFSELTLRTNATRRFLESTSDFVSSILVLSWADARDSFSQAKLFSGFLICFWATDSSCGNISAALAKLLVGLYCFPIAANCSAISNSF